MCISKKKVMNKRPLSPHLSIYKKQITSGVSIIGRLCGVYVYFFTIVLLWSMIVSIYKYNNPSIPFYLIVMALHASTPVFSFISYIILFVTVFCITFFTGTMIRHILWDHNLALELKTSSILGYIITALACFTSIVVVSLVSIM